MVNTNKVMPITFLFIVMIFLTRQMQLKEYNVVMTTATICLCMYGWRVIYIPFISIFFSYLLMIFLLGIYYGANIIDAFRFLVIISCSLFAFFFKPVRSIPIKTILIIGLVQAFVVIFLAVYLGIAQDEILARSLRIWATDEAGGGDIYSYNQIFYRVQLVGNALLPFLFFLSVHLRNNGKFYLFCAFFFAISIIFAGNLTYWIGCVLFLIYEFRGGGKSKILFISFVLSAPVLFIYIVELIQMKFDGGASSMGVRFDQLNSIFMVFNTNPITLVTGAGLGVRIPSGLYRDYSQSVYIEIQSAYIFMQMGLLGMFAYCIAFIKLSLLCLDEKYRVILFFYIFCSISNPYIFDTNQILVTALLAVLSNKELRSSGALYEK